MPVSLPDQSPPGLTTLTTFHGDSLGPAIYAPGLSVGVPVSAVIPTANDAYYISFIVRKLQTTVELLANVGAANTGNIDIGVYRQSDNVKLGSSGSVALGTVNVLQKFTLALVLPPGRYFWGVALNNAAGTLMRSNPSVRVCKMLGMAMQATAFPLPATATPASIGTNNWIPLVGHTYKTGL